MPIANALVINDELLLKKCNKFEPINEPNGPINEPNLGIDLINSITHSGLKKLIKTVPFGSYFSSQYQILINSKGLKHPVRF